jgi:hypothetical protein
MIVNLGALKARYAKKRTFQNPSNSDSDSQHPSGGWEGRKYGTSVWLGWNDVAASFFYLSIGPRLTHRLTDFSMLPADSCGFYAYVSYPRRQ